MTLISFTIASNAYILSKKVKEVKDDMEAHIKELNKRLDTIANNLNKVENMLDNVKNNITEIKADMKILMGRWGTSKSPIGF